MSSKRRRPTGYRAPAPAEPPTRRGLLDSVFPKAFGATPMPKLRRTFARGSALVLSTPALAVGVPVSLFVAWLALLAAGFQGPLAVLNGFAAVPPVGNLTDLNLSTALFGGAGPGSLAWTFGFVLLRGLVIAVITTVAIERLRGGAVTWWALRRLGRVFPVAAAVSVLSLTALVVGQLIAALLGAGPGLLAYVGLIIAGIYLLGFAPAVAADEDRAFGWALRRAIRVARMPGSSNLTFAVLYALGAGAVLVAPVPGSDVGVNPAVSAWMVSIVANLLHATAIATLAYRYLAVAGAVPDTAAVPAR